MHLLRESYDFGYELSVDILVHFAQFWFALVWFLNDYSFCFVEYPIQSRLCTFQDSKQGLIPISLNQSTFRYQFVQILLFKYGFNFPQCFFFIVISRRVTFPLTCAFKCLVFTDSLFFPDKNKWKYRWYVWINMAAFSLLYLQPVITRPD